MLCVKRPISKVNSFLCMILKISGIASNTYQFSDAENGLVGEIMKGNQVSIFSPDEDGIGQVCVLTKTMAQGLENQYYNTGDFGYLEGNKLYLTGRRNKVINHSGEKIMPADVERMLMKVSGVREAAAFPIPSESHGEDICIAVDGTLTFEEAQSCLPKYMWPKYIFSVDKMPTNASGKRDEQALIEMARGYMESE